jgi:AAHS family 4-hydroxybenzoate transporter-like MFS transporter
MLVLVVFVAGTLMNAAQSSMPALAAAYYPTQGRATGVAWMLGIGRFGGIAGSFLVAELTRRQLDFTSIFAVVAIPGVIATAALLIKQAARPESTEGYGKLRGEVHIDGRRIVWRRRRSAVLTHMPDTQLIERVGLGGALQP